LSGGRPQQRDALLAVAFGICWFSGIWFALGHGWYPSAIWTYRVAGIYTIGVLLTREIWPRATLLVVAVSYPIAYGTALVTEFHLLPILLAAYSVAAAGRLRPAWILLIAEPVVLVLFIPPESLWNLLVRQRNFWLWDFSRVGLTEVATAFVVLLGRAALRQTRASVELRQRHRELERLRRMETEQVVSAERTRIARELHDVVAHHISAVVIRAQAADRVADTQPEATREAVRWIAANGQDTLIAMRHVVRVLRSSEIGGGVEPQTSLAELPQMAERMSAVGLEVELRLPEVVPVLPAAVELAIVRIIQEALTNVLVHANAGRALVELEIGPDDQIRLAVHDNGSAGAPPTTPINLFSARPVTPPALAGLTGLTGLGGNGLIGMRERAASCGGALAIGTSPLGGWLVTAVLRSTMGGLVLASQPVELPLMAVETERAG
jgi:signal transduction histidine kinase